MLLKTLSDILLAEVGRSANHEVLIRTPVSVAMIIDGVSIERDKIVIYTRDDNVIPVRSTVQESRPIHPGPVAFRKDAVKPTSVSKPTLTATSKPKGIIPEI
jgi:hypothetical protein